MGFDLQVTRFVLAAKEAGADFADVLTLGRQSIHITEAVYRAEAKRFGLPHDPEAVRRAYENFPYVDGILRALGATQPAALDAARHEGANIIADLNSPVPPDLANRFSLIIDGGTIEHVFNVPQAFASIGRMLRVGGHVVSVNGTNNFTGHGFYQFSPELLYRAFSPENGFEVEAMVFTEVHEDGEWHEIADPAKVGARVQLANSAKTYLMMRARKVADVEMFGTPPQQSDYHDQNWAQGEADLSFPTLGWKQRLAKYLLPRSVRCSARQISHAMRRPYASPHFTKVTFRQRQNG